MGSILSNFTNGVQVIGYTTLARGSQSNGALDLTKNGSYAGNLGARLTLGIGRTAITNALSSGVIARVFESEVDASGVKLGMPAQIFAQLSQTAAADIGTNLNGSHASGITALTVQAYTQAKLLNGDFAFLYAAGPVRSEFVALGYSGSTTTMTLLTPLAINHASNADTVYNKADVWTYDLKPGKYYDINFDYLAQTTGDSVVVVAMATINPSLTY